MFYWGTANTFKFPRAHVANFLFQQFVILFALILSPSTFVFSLRACDEPFRISHYQLIHGIAHILLSLVASDLLSTRAWRVCMIDSGDRRATSKVLQSLQNGLRTRSRPSN